MTTYEPTRSGKKKFLRDLVPGRTYYSIEEADTPLPGLRYVREWTFKKSRLWVGTCGHMSAEAVLSNYGPLYDEQPAGLPNLFDDRDHKFAPRGAALKEYQQAMKEMQRRARQEVGA